MKKGEKLPRARKTDLLINDCRNLRCDGQITLQKFVGITEGTNKLNGHKLYFGTCLKCLNGDIFYSGYEINIVNLELIPEKLDGDYRIIKVD